MITHTRLTTENGSSLTVYVNGNLHTITDDHPSFDQVVDGLAAGTLDESEVENLVTGSRTAVVADHLRQLTDHVSFDGTDVLFDGEPVVKPIAEHIRRSLSAGTRDWKPLARFMERLAKNPSRVSRTQLYSWLQAAGLTIIEDGRFVAYKYLTTDGTSVRTGPGIVDGEHMVGHLPNRVGSMIEMDRSSVDDDRDNSCSVGLHVGTYGYATSCPGNHLIATVLVDPADAVSVPREDDRQKMRTCKYEVARVEQPNMVSYLGDRGAVVTVDEDEDDEDECDLCGSQLHDTEDCDDEF